MTAWVRVADRLPKVGAYVLVWVGYRDGSGRVMIAEFRADRIVHSEEESHFVDDPNFQWSGGDNDREWPLSLNWHGHGGYWFDEAGDHVTHWMPLPEAP